MHLYQGSLDNLTLGTPNVPTPSAMSWFGQLRIYAELTLEEVHMHFIEVPASGSDVSLEVWRARGIDVGEPIAWLRLATLTVSPTGSPQTFVRTVGVPIDPDLQLGDYLFAQLTDKNNAFDGMTLSFHYVQPIS